MDRFGTIDLRIFATLVMFLMAGAILSVSGCPPFPTIANAYVVGFGPGYVDYRCDIGYVPVGNSTRLLCKKDSAAWSGNLTCKESTCSNPPYPRTGHGNYSLSIQGNTWTATYYCDPTYVLKPGPYLTTTYFRSCSRPITVWSGTTPTCVRPCNSIDIAAPAHGRVSSRTPHYRFTTPIQGVTVSFSCDIRYRLEGSASRRCLESGVWSGIKPRCVPSSCEPCIKIIVNGQATFNSSPNESGYPIWTNVTFTCHSGYQLIGVTSRQCQPNGQWTGQHNPQCIESNRTCPPPDRVTHGQYTPEKPIYLLNVGVHLVCMSGYFLWGDAWQLCTSENGGSWITLSSCHVGDSCDPTGYTHPECLPQAVYVERCEKTFGHHATFRGKNAFCSPISATKIVAATAGSILGALVVLLTALACFWRFRHNIRRLLHSAFRSRPYSDGNRISHTTDMHFIQPSYGEAINQVGSLPPSFESVVDSEQGRGNETAQVC